MLLHLVEAVAAWAAGLVVSAEVVLATTLA